MFLPIILGLAGLGFLVLLAMIAYGSWIAHKMTVMERVSLDSHPTTLGLSCEDVEFPSRGDEVPLSGWYLPAAQDDRCVILIQGTHHHRNDPQIRALRLGRDLVEGGFSVLLFDFRARGESGGNRSSEGDREQWDVFGAIDYLVGRGIPVERIGLLGFSLGAGVAILVAAQEPRIPAVVSDSGFLDYMKELRQLYIGPFLLPSWFAGFVVLAGRALFDADFRNVRPVHVVEGISQPIFFIHGEDDSVIHHEESRELHIVSDNHEDRIWIVPGAEHVNVYRKMPEEYIRRVSSFFQRHLLENELANPIGRWD
jgi:fermentation-respiration switch protein FrsA (DUF1100 family)